MPIPDLKKESDLTTRKERSQNAGFPDVGEGSLVDLTAELNLSDMAKKDLLKVLEKEIGPDKVKELSDGDLNKIGLLLLNILAEGLKFKVSGSN